MASGKPWKQEGYNKSDVMNIEHDNVKASAPPQPASMNGRGEPKKNGNKKEKDVKASASPQPASKNGRGEQKKNGNKKKKGKGSSDVFNVQDNNIKGDKADKNGVFDFGNKYVGSKKPKEDESSEEESDSGDQDEE